MRATEQSYQKTLALKDKGDFTEYAQLDGKYWAFNDACRRLIVAVDREMIAMAGADPGKLEQSR